MSTHARESVRPVCITPGCWTYPPPGHRYCLACQLDRNIPQPPLQPRLGRPPRRTCQADGCTRPVQTWCPLCDQVLCHLHDELVAYRGHRCLRDQQPITSVDL